MSLTSVLTNDKLFTTWWSQVCTWSKIRGIHWKVPPILHRYFRAQEQTIVTSVEHEVLVLLTASFHKLFKDQQIIRVCFAVKLILCVEYLVGYITLLVPLIWKYGCALLPFWNVCMMNRVTWITMANIVYDTCPEKTYLSFQTAHNWHPMTHMYSKVWDGMYGLHLQIWSRTVSNVISNLDVLLKINFTTLNPWLLPLRQRHEIHWY